MSLLFLSLCFQLWISSRCSFPFLSGRRAAQVTILIRNSLKSLTLQVKQRIIDVDTKNSLGDYLRSGHSFSEFSTVSVLKCYEYLKFYDFQVWSVTSRNCLTTHCKFFTFLS